MGGLVWYFCPSLETWNSMTFLKRVHWLAWLIAIAAISYLGTLVVLGIRKEHLLARK